MSLNLKRREIYAVVVIVLLASILLVIGWKVFWFFSDDAYISFRYISNSMLGYGYVWNPPPFKPVEGYTNFLWMVLLEVFWRLFNLEPPETANNLSLIFSILTLIIFAGCILKMNFSDKLKKYRIPLLAIGLLGVVTNRTILAWSSSGLETAMFNFLIMFWIYRSVFVSSDKKHWGLSLAVLSTLIYLTRPDGILIVIATFLMLILVNIKAKPILNRLHLISASPFLVVLLHFGWRKIKYGEWLPNTYYAKYVGAWPQSGIRYLASFILEYALWIWLALGATVLLRYLLGKKGSSAGSYTLPIVVTTVLSHLLYYTIVIGGDHFEYRVYSHLIYLAFISFIWMLNVLQLGQKTALGLLALFMLLSLPVPWSHWALTRNLDTREQTNKMHVRVAESWPRPLDLYVRGFDDMQHWLINHYVCVRHQEHKVNSEYISSLFPSRERGSMIRASGYPVFAFPAIGIVSWVLPNINIIDLHGLNDYVIARNTDKNPEGRMMAHERSAPENYVQCFMPNVRLRGPKDVIILKRPEELTAEDIRECEQKWMEMIK